MWRALLGEGHVQRKRCLDRPDAHGQYRLEMVVREHFHALKARRATSNLVGVHQERPHLADRSGDRIATLEMHGYGSASPCSSRMR